MAKSRKTRRRRKKPSLTLWLRRRLIWVLVVAAVGWSVADRLPALADNPPLGHPTAASAQPVAGQGWPARLDHVSDGDTVTVVNQANGSRYRVRLQGIDAPEVDHGRGRPGQRYGQRAKYAMRQLLSSATIRVVPDGTTSYDRIVAGILVNGQDVATMLVARGLAWRYPRYDQAGRYAQAQREAQAADLGLWSQSDPIAPWNWRHQVWTR